jgi:hypothetical protein
VWKVFGDAMKTEAEIRRVRNIWEKAQAMLESRFGRVISFDTEIATIDYILGENELLDASLDQLESVLKERGVNV